MRKEESKLRKALHFLITIVCIGCAVVGLTYALMPKIPDFYREDYYDAVFFGTSHCYCSFNPAVFDEYELKTYNLGRAQQPIEYTYYMMKDALENSEIDVVVLEVYAFIYSDWAEMHESVGIRDTALGSMRNTGTKYDAIRELVPEEQQLAYLFPLDKYHTNWENWEYTSVRGLWNSVTNRYYTEESDRGYYGWEGSKTMDLLPPEALLAETEYDVWEQNWDYMNRIKELCEEHGTTLILVKSPTPMFPGAIEVCRSMEHWAADNDVDMINFTLLLDEIGFDQSTDSWDGGEHLNKSGAEKVSRYLAEYILEQRE